MAPHLVSASALRAASRWWVLAAMGAGLLSACSPANSPGGEPACVAAMATVPNSAHPGQTIKVPMENLYSDCYDQGQGLANPGADTVTLTLFDGATQTTVATATAPVEADARALVTLTVPADASRGLAVVYNGLTMGVVTIAPAK